MDLNKIFNMFEEYEGKEDDTNLLIDFSEHPLYWIGGFNKIISNYLVFVKYTSNIFKNMSNDIREEDLDKVSTLILFERAWEYISKFNIDNKFHLECLKIKSSESLKDALEIAINHYEQLEEYEKCAFLKNILDKVKEFLI